VLKRTQLLQRLRGIERRRRQPGKAQQDVAPKRVQADVLQAARRAGEIPSKAAIPGSSSASPTLPGFALPWPPQAARMKP
jgi:hypothetical protein